MKVATWNVNSITSRLDRLLAFLARTSPDILCLQELKCVEELFPTAALEKAGYQAAVFGQKTYNGVAILSKKPLTDVRRSFEDGHPDEAARFVGATIGNIRVYSVYVPNGQEVGSDKYAYKLEWMKRLRLYLDRVHHKADRVLLCGDFNITPDDRDVYDPGLWRGKILCSGRERKALETVCAWGLSDTLRLQTQEEGFYSWWDYRMQAFPRNHGLRIDLILASTPLLAEVKRTWMDRDERKGEKPSDHVPVIAEFA